MANGRKTTRLNRKDFASDLDPRWRLLDSLDANQSGDLNYEASDPAPGEEGYPRLILENRAYQTRQFRSLHMEMAYRQDGFQVRCCSLNPCDWRTSHGSPETSLVQRLVACTDAWTEQYSYAPCLSHNNYLATRFYHSLFQLLKYRCCTL